MSGAVIRDQTSARTQHLRVLGAQVALADAWQSVWRAWAALLIAAWRLEGGK